MHWLGWVVLAAVAYSGFILVMAWYESGRVLKRAKEERRTHRRTWPHPPDTNSPEVRKARGAMVIDLPEIDLEAHERDLESRSGCGTS